LQIKLKTGNIGENVAVYIYPETAAAGGIGKNYYQRKELGTNDNVILFPGNDAIQCDFEEKKSFLRFIKPSSKLESWKTKNYGDKDPHACLAKDARCTVCKEYAEKKGSSFVNSGSGNAQQNVTGPENSGNAQQNATGQANVPTPNTTRAQGASRKHPSFLTPGIPKSETKCPNCDAEEIPSTKDPIFLSNPSDITASNANPSAVPGPANATGAPATTIGPQGPIGPGGPSGGEGDSANTKSPESKSDKVTAESNLDGKHEEQDITDPATDPGTSEVSPNAKDLDDVAEDANILPSEETEMEIE
jgi:hypothetical protein